MIARFALDRHRILGKDRRRVKQRTVMLSAIETMANTDPMWTPCRDKPDVAAQAASRGSLDGESPSSVSEMPVNQVDHSHSIVPGGFDV
ncbi:MAG TPA: hypothetical protein VFP53_07460 [Sphingomicrobium sp.]|nr:hypothetical protein [Sphingomicrobium sp.]